MAAVVALLVAVVLFTATSLASPSGLPGDYPFAVLDTDFGLITWRLRPDHAPLTVANFARLCRDGFFSNSTFYRYESGFVLQGGGDRAMNDTGVSNQTVPLEYSLPNANMTVGLARDERPDSGSSEYFINLGDNSARLAPNASAVPPTLGYTVFAEVVAGFDVVAKISQQPLNPQPVDGQFHVFASPRPRVRRITIANVSATCTAEVQQKKLFGDFGPSASMPHATIQTKSWGSIKLQLRPDAAPLTVANFKRLIKAGFYKNSSFYRYEPDWVIQAGQDEFHHGEDTSHYVPVEYCLPNENLTVGVSRFDHPNSGSSEYFINVNNNTDALRPGGKTLFGYTVFAVVLEGVDVLNRLAALPTEPDSPGSPYRLFKLPYPEVVNIELDDGFDDSEEVARQERNAMTAGLICICLSVSSTTIGTIVYCIVRKWRKAVNASAIRSKSRSESELVVDGTPLAESGTAKPQEPRRVEY